MCIPHHGQWIPASKNQLVQIDIGKTPPNEIPTGVKEMNGMKARIIGGALQPMNGMPELKWMLDWDNGQYLVTY